MVKVYLSLGSNLEPERNLAAALRELQHRFGVLTISPTYRSSAVGFDGPDFLNLAVGLETELEPPALDLWLHALEDRHGRRRDVPRFSSRTLDADIVLYDDRIVRGPGNLELPRPDLRHAFVLKPVADIAPELVHPLLGKTMAQLWREFPAASEPLHDAPPIAPS